MEHMFADVTGLWLQRGRHATITENGPRLESMQIHRERILHVLSMNVPTFSKFKNDI